MSQNEAIKSNVPEFSVSDLAFSLKRTLEDTYGRVRVRGELSRVSIASSGHMYSSLKDDNAVLDAVCWKTVMPRLSVRPEEGLEVICTGKISSYPQRSNYQLIIESMEPAGEGALLKMLEERRKKLAAEGLFNPERKRPLPFLPTVIGVVTSPTGSVIRDILHRLQDRFPRHVLLWPALVQGQGAADQVTAAIRGFQKAHEKGLPRPDVLIIARGGGSLEDLMPFNEENIVRAIAESEIPIISAVGHETDTTLADYAADMRAPTPTAAAEMAVPVRMQLMAQVLDDEKRLVNGMMRVISENRHRLEAQSARLAHPDAVLNTKMQQLDHLQDKMRNIFKHYIGVKTQSLTTVSGRLRHPQDRINHMRQNLKQWSDRLQDLAPKLTKDLQQKLEHTGKMLEAYSFENVLDRGFALVEHQDGALVTQADQAKPGDLLTLRFKQKQSLKTRVENNE